VDDLELYKDCGEDKRCYLDRHSPWGCDAGESYPGILIGFLAFVESVWLDGFCIHYLLELCIHVEEVLSRYFRV
jgi:hypothetical protein